MGLIYIKSVQGFKMFSVQGFTRFKKFSVQGTDGEGS